MSKSYISQVKHGKCPPSQRLLDSLVSHIRTKPQDKDYLALFFESRKATGVSPKTVLFYQYMLLPFVAKLDYLKVTRQDIERYLNSIPPNQYGLATRHATYRAIKTFYRWLDSQFGLRNPVKGMSVPILGKPILSGLDKEQVLSIIDRANNARDKVIIALFVESGLRLSELAHIKLEDIDWCSGIIKVIGKGRKEAYAPFGEMTRKYLNEWLTQYSPNGNIRGINDYSIKVMLQRLEHRTGTKCNPHTFRRSFACLLRKAG